jgi:cephalosporin-C deacetylase-like acetyl esterase
MQSPLELTNWSRRDLVRAAGLGVCGLSGLGDLARGQEKPAAALAPFNRFPRMMQEYYVARIRGLEQRMLEKKNALKTRADAEAYVKEVRERIAKAFAPMPKEKTPLNARVTGTLDRDGYAVEKVIFESRPKFFVTANLYLPKGRAGRVPGVVGSCGHSPNGKMEAAYQSFAQGLARQGTACLIFDPIGQGERHQYVDEAHGLKYKGATHEHNKAGNQMELVGEFLGSWRAWDGIRALDYLLTRPEIDPQHVGITGNSGGGTMTTWLMGLEPRWTMGAPGCFVSTWRRNLENELPQDNEQCPPRSLALGLDHDDYLAAMAPKPVIILAKELDYFDARGSEETYERLRRLYALLGAEKNVQLHIGPTAHGYTQENREAMYRFFNSITKASDAQAEPAITVEKDADLWCTPTGQVNADLGSRTVFSLTKGKAERLKQAREAKPATADALKQAVAGSLRLPERDPKSPPNVRILRARGGDRKYPKKYWINYAVDSEPRIQAVCTMLGDEPLNSRPPRAPEGKPGRVLLWISDRSADAELRDEPLIRELMEKEGAGVPVFACDVRGIGDSLPGTAGGDPLSYYGADYFYAAYANMFARPYLGGKTHDVLRTIDFLAEYGWTDIHLASRGWGCLPGGFAALLDDRVKTVTLRDRLESWHSVAVEEHYEWPLSHMIFGVLRDWDLPDVWKALEGRTAKV